MPAFCLRWVFQYLATFERLDNVTSGTISYLLRPSYGR